MVADLDKIRELGLPFWLAGSYGRPGKLAAARERGAAGIQVGTAFAFCQESGIQPELKQQAIQAGIYPKRFPIPVLAREFSAMVKKHGRITEMLLVIKLFLKTNPFAAMGNWRLGIDLLKTGRFSLATEKIKQHGDIARMLDTTDVKKDLKAAS